MFRKIPEPEYERSIRRLVTTYKRAIRRINEELAKLDVTDLRRANTQVALSEVSRILSSLNGDAAEWVAENIPLAAREGVARTLLALNVASTMDEALKIVKFNRINSALVSAAISDTQSDLLAITQNVDRRVRAAVRKAMSDSMRANMAAGISGRRTIARDALAEIRKTLDNSITSGIVDASGRRWRPEVYVDTVTRTKMLSVYNEASTNEAIQRKAYYAVISSHGATDACRFHEGRIIKLTPEAPGNYPTYEQLRATGQIWHPNCKHTYSVIRDPNLLPPDVRSRAEKQTDIGEKAVRTGKRNPTDIE